MKKTTALMIAGAGCVLMSPVAFAAGFQLQDFGVAANGRANAGETAMADTAATIARNPASMGNFDKATISVVYHYINPDIDVEGTSTNLLNNTVVDSSMKDVAPSASVPGFYYVQPINEQWAVGLAFNSHFGLATDYGSDFVSAELANKTSITTYYLTPNVSFKPIESLTIGLGINYIYGEGEIKNSLGSNITAVPLPQGTNALDLDGDGDAWGYTLGLMWNINEQTRLGLRYQSRVNLDIEGEMIKLNGIGAQEKSDGTLTINLPEMYELGLAYDATDRVTLLAGIQKTGWHVFKDLTVKVNGGGADQLKVEDWQDAWRYSIGAEFKTTDWLKLRAGYAYDESPVKENMRHLSIPDADRNWYTLGASFDLKEAGGIDVSFVYLDGGSAKVSETSAVGTRFDGKLSSTKAYIYSIGYNISF